MNRDTLGHSSIQPWSAGPLFPAIIAVIERYAERNLLFPQFDRVPLEFVGLESRIQSTSYELTIGAFREEYGTREDAEMVARWACADGRIIPERYAQLTQGAGHSMAAFGMADPDHQAMRPAAMAPDVPPQDILPACACEYWRGAPVCHKCGRPNFGGVGGAS